MFAGIMYCLFALAVGSTYVIAQHDGRSAVEDAPRALLSAPSIDGRPGRLDLARYEGVFWARYDRADQPIAGNGYLDGARADIPKGVLATARAFGGDAVTWQPADGRRFAIVAQAEPGGDVLVAGQSLHRTEQRATESLVITLLVLFAGAVVTAVGLVLSWLLGRRSVPR